MTATIPAPSERSAGENLADLVLGEETRLLENRYNMCVTVGSMGHRPFLRQNYSIYIAERAMRHVDAHAGRTPPLAGGDGIPRLAGAFDFQRQKQRLDATAIVPLHCFRKWRC